MGSIYGWSLVLVSRHGLYVRVRLSVGMDALSLRQLEDGSGFWLDVAARIMEQLGCYTSICGNTGGWLPRTSCSHRNDQYGCCRQGRAGALTRASIASDAGTGVSGNRRSARIVGKFEALEPGGGEVRPATSSACTAIQCDVQL